MAETGIISNSYVSRAGVKLEYAMEHFNISVSGLTCADFGSSTGGFVDCLLQRGAKKVYSIDTAYGVLAWKLRNDPRVEVLERTNAIYVILPEKVDLITVDVGWTPQKLIIPNAIKNLRTNGIIITLLKPHYERKKAKLSEQETESVVKEAIEMFTKETNVEMMEIVESPIKGFKGGNTEYLFALKLKDSLA